MDGVGGHEQGAGAVVCERQAFEGGECDLIRDDGADCDGRVVGAWNVGLGLFGTGAAVVFKGSGFYQTDYRSESYKKAAEKDKPASESKSEAKSDGKSESKSESKTESAKTKPTSSGESKKKSD